MSYLKIENFDKPLEGCVMLKNEKIKKRFGFNEVAAIVVFVLLMLAIFSAYVTTDLYNKYGIGALEEQVHQKYLQEQKTTEPQEAGGASASAETSGEHTNVYTYASDGDSF